MMLVGSAQTLAAVARSLAAHVLPAVDDDFARLQVLAAIRALDEVGDRLVEGDPCTRLTADLEEALAAVAAGVAADDRPGAARLEAALADLPRTAEARDRRSELSARLVGVVAGLGGDTKAQVLRTLQDDAAQAAGVDATWACREAIESLQ